MILDDSDPRGLGNFESKFRILDDSLLFSEKVVIVNSSELEEGILREWVDRGLIRKVALVGQKAGGVRESFLLTNAVKIRPTLGISEDQLSAAIEGSEFVLRVDKRIGRSTYELSPKDPLGDPSATVELASQLAKDGLLDESRTTSLTVEIESNKHRQ